MAKYFSKNYFGIFFLSASILIFELILIRIFSVVLKNNFSFFAITITLFGIALGGLIVFIKENHFSKENFSKNIFRYSILFGTSLLIFPFIFFQINFANLDNNLSLILIILSVTPFILGNITIVLLFKEKSSNIKKIYFFDLLGAGIGVILAILLMNHFGAINGIFIASVLAFLSAYIFMHKTFQNKIILISCLVVITIGTIFNLNYNFIDIVNTKEGQENVGLIFKQWNSFSRITVHDTDVFYKLPNKEYNTYSILIDAGASTDVIEFDGNLSKASFLKSGLASAPYHITDPGTSLIIGPGGGKDILSALLFNFNVKGIEINPIIVNDVMRGKLYDFSGQLYDRDDVEIIISDGRSFLEKNDNIYSVIHIPLVDTWSSTVAGNLTLVESYLYTVEAFEQYLSHLEPEGILSFTRWEIDGMRLLSLYFEASKNLNITNTELNIAVISRDEASSYQLNNYLFKKNPFTQEEILKLNKFVEENNYSISYIPNTELKNNYSDYITSSNKDNFIKTYSTKLDAVYDNDPFYFFTSPITKISIKNQMTRNYGFTLFVVFLFTLFFSIIIIIIPLFIKREKIISNHTKWQSFSLIIYFGLIGLGFLLLEISLIQKFILYLEQPIYSYSVVLITLLIFAGIGSYISDRISSINKLNFLKIPLIIFSLLIVGLIGMDNIITLTVGYNIIYKIIITTIINIPLSLFMGMMLPMGIKRLELINRNDLIPWAWATNGAMSVVASVLAMILGITFGLKAVMLIAGILYLLTPLMIYFSPKYKKID